MTLTLESTARMVILEKSLTSHLQAGPGYSPLAVWKWTCCWILVVILGRQEFDSAPTHDEDLCKGVHGDNPKDVW